MKFARDNYVLSFWVRGVSIFVTDIHRDAYKDLEALFIIDEGMFKQYFARAAYERALDRGLSFYSNKTAFVDYKQEMVRLGDAFKYFFESHIHGRKSLAPDVVGGFFDYTKKLCCDYTKMNFEFTDTAYKHQEDNPLIKKHLEVVAKLKDKVRELMNAVLFESDGYSSEVFGILGNVFDVAPSSIEQLTQKEILGLFEGKKPDVAKVAKRQEAFVESCGVDGWYEGDAAREIIAEFKDDTAEVTVIQGNVASKGRVSGTVKIIPVEYSDAKRMSEAIDEMQQGEILVAEPTAPELIVACRKAGAIVTDMGDLLSHAAIVSREFGIPCVVGTQNASKILRNGDEVEVDAEGGFVRVLQRNH